MTEALKDLDHLHVFMMIYIDSIESGIRFTFDEYLIARKKYIGGNYYFLTHTDGAKQKCILDYFPLPGYKDMRALVEFGRGEDVYWKEVPVKYLEKT